MSKIDKKIDKYLIDFEKMEPPTLAQTRDEIKSLLLKQILKEMPKKMKGFWVAEYQLGFNQSLTQCKDAVKKVLEVNKE